MSTLSPEELRTHRQTRPGVVLDVRTPAEYDGGHLEDADNVDFLAPDFANRVEGLDRDETYYLYCRSGQRSGKAAELMRSMGFADVHNAGGYEALAAAGHRVA
jgi:phage shock protein E